MDEGTARIELRRKNKPSLWTVIDAEDYERVGQYRWRAAEGEWTTYAVTNVNCRTTYLHRFIYAEISRNWRPGVDDELLSSIGQKGVLEPVLLGDDHRVWEGHHRILFAHWHDRDRPIPIEHGVGGRLSD